MLHTGHHQDGTEVFFSFWLSDKTWMLGISAVKDGDPWFIEYYGFETFVEAIDFAREYGWWSR